MSLNPSTGSDDAKLAIAQQIALVFSTDPDANPKTNKEIAKDIAAAYHAYAKEGVLSGADLTGGGDVTLLESAFEVDISTPQAQANMQSQIATGICDYWSSINTVSDTATHGGTTVVSVVVKGGDKLTDMKQAVETLVTEAENLVDPIDGWLKFYQRTEAIVKTIPCVITELMPGSLPYEQAFLVMMERGASSSAKSHLPLPKITLRPEDASNWRVNRSDRKYKSVIAKHYDLKTATEISVQVGSGEPVYEMQSPPVDNNEPTQQSIEEKLESSAKAKVEGNAAKYHFRQHYYGW